MLAIKLKRVGKKHQASYRVVVDEKRHKLFGTNAEDLGWYNPHQHKSEINKERTLHWIKNGAKPTDTVHNLLIKEGIIEGKKIPVHNQPKKGAAPEGATTPAPADAKPAEAAAEKPAAEPAKEEKPKAEAKAEEKPTA